ncbi:MAG: hypothetical protein WC008_06010 [Bacilli bacterium]
MKVKFDLHIHSKLSPCASELMTPNNIMNMCMLKGLGLVAVTDHNSILQQDSLTKISESYDFIYINGIEITTIEGFHVLGYFDSLDKCRDFYNCIINHYDQSIKSNNPKKQVIFDEYDQEIGYVDYNLHQKINIDTTSLLKMIRLFNGIIVLAHIDRQKTGITNYDIDFQYFDFDGFEIDDKDKIDELYRSHSFLKKYKMINNSDSHDITSINENEYIELDELSFEGLKAWFYHD